MKYYRKHWPEKRTDQYAIWGHSDWYFESRPDGTVVRQVEVYENGPALRYDETHPQNEYGRLAETRLELSQFAGCEIPAEAFTTVWNSARP